MAHETRVVDSGVGQFETKDLFISCVEWMLSSNYLVHGDAQRPHICGSPIALQVDHFRSPIDKSVRHGFRY